MSQSTVSAYTSIQDFLDKASWEGGVAGGISYGLRAEKDLIEEVKTANPEFVKLWDEAAEALFKLENFVYANFSID